MDAVRVVLANPDYARHTTDEGWQLQQGLACAGWKLAGKGLQIDSTDAAWILDQTNPEVVFVQDVRDWSPDSSGCFDRSVAFRNVDALKDHPRVWTVVKDAGSLIDYQRRFAERIGACGIVHYYAADAVTNLSPWLSDYALVRTWHSVDADLCRSIDIGRPRQRGIVTGALSDVYPLRKTAFQQAAFLRIDALRHPGYGNGGWRTPRYLEILSRYRTHVATASRYGFALRKIVESAAMGCTPVTNLPKWDVLPEIDGALFRVESDISAAGLKAAIDEAESQWHLGAARFWADQALKFYDFKALGRRLSEAISPAAVAA